MSQDEFTKLFKYMEKRFDLVDKKFEAQDKKINNIQSSVDGLAKMVTEYHQEMIMLTRKVDRMERWIHEIAEKTGVKLSYS
jgi:uncharacterized coiled-coil DUF342 family protein